MFAIVLQTKKVSLLKLTKYVLILLLIYKFAPVFYYVNANEPAIVIAYYYNSNTESRNKIHLVFDISIQALTYALKIFNYFFTAVFILESVMKLVALGLHLYFKDK